MALSNGFVLASSGILVGVLAGLLGIGGGTLMVPLLVALGCSPIESVATSSFAILITASSGSLQNWRMGYLSLHRVLPLAIPALLTAQLGAYLANRAIDYVLLAAFGGLLLVNVYLISLRKQLTATDSVGSASRQALFTRLGTGGLAGLLAGLFGVGGGVVMVPLQVLLLGETIKVAIQTSLGVIVITALSAVVGHAWRGHVLLWDGFLLGLGGLLGSQLGTRFLPKLPDRIISVAFRSLLLLLALYVFIQAWQRYGVGG